MNQSRAKKINVGIINSVAATVVTSCGTSGASATDTSVI
jgi:hypothetical protein